LSPVIFSILPIQVVRGVKKKVEVRGIPHLAKNERDVGHPSAGGRERIKEATLSTLAAEKAERLKPVPFKVRVFRRLQGRYVHR
jgi:hypothetical protein